MCAKLGEMNVIPMLTIYNTICRFSELHHFYDSLCPACAALNYQKRLQTSSMHGRVAIVTGGLVPIILLTVHHLADGLTGE